MARLNVFSVSCKIVLPAAITVFFISGCATTPKEVRYDDTTIEYAVAKDGDSRSYQHSPNSTRYQVSQYGDATANYRLQPGNRKHFRPGQDGVPTSSSGLYGSSGQNGSTGDKMKGTTIVLDITDILFDFDKSVLRSEFLPELDKWADFFLANPDVTAEIQGHADSTGTEEYNQTLSEKRAQAVINYLVGRGVDPQRFTAVGFGESLPVAPNSTKEGRQQNRRVEMTF